MFEILFLGTGASVLSRDHALPCVAVRRGSDIVLFDCGEGSQRQLMISSYSFMKIRGIFITHMHGDHFYGLPGLLQTMGMMGRKEKLVIRGPDGFTESLKVPLSLCEGGLGYELDMADMSPGDVVDIGELKVSAFKTEHGIVSQGYVLKEPGTRGRINSKKAKKLGIEGTEYSFLEAGQTVKGVTLGDVCSVPKAGKSVAYTGDTARCQTLDDAVRGADVLIHECTYVDRDWKLAEEHFHSTAKSAAETARDCGVGSLFLTHISNRYRERSEVENEAKSIFPRTYVPEDLALFKMSKTGFKSA